MQTRAMLAAMLATSVACGGSNGGNLDRPADTFLPATPTTASTPRSSGPDAASSVIGPGGGSVRLADGTGVAIPKGALADDTEITVHLATAAPAPPYGEQLGPVFLFGPEGQTFAAPVTVTLSFDATKFGPGESARDVQVFTSPRAKPAFVRLPTTVVDETHVSVQSSHFSYFVVTRGTPSDADASTALEQMLLTYWSQKDRYMLDTSASGATGYWIFAQSLDAVLDGVERTGGEHFQGLVKTFYDAQASRSDRTFGHGFSATGYYDDENWMALALIRAHDLTGNGTYLDTAEHLYADIESAWDDTCCGSSPGGLWWDKIGAANGGHTQKATASNLGPVITGARLYERTRNGSYLTFARKAYAFWTAHMVDSSTHHVYDHIDASSGKVISDVDYTYNEGLLIGADVELSKATGDASYLADAAKVAQFVHDHETKSGSLGLALSDAFPGSGPVDNKWYGTCSDCQEFKGIAFRYLAALVEADPSQTTTASLLASSVTSAWGLARSGDRFAPDWTGPSESNPMVQADASATMSLNVFARLAGGYVSDGSKNTRLQAEEANFENLGLEATHAGFEGWGYVAGWGSDGQSVTFSFETTSASTYALGFRYASTGDASRIVSVDGRNETLSFPDTKSWTAYGTASLTTYLGSGSHTVTVDFQSAHGSKGYLNLDEMTVAQAPATPAPCGTLQAGHSLAPSNQIVSCNRQYWLILSPTGNLDEDEQNHGEIWSVKGPSGDRLDMQADGNLVLYRGSSALWASGTQGHPGAYLALGDKGNLAVHASSGANGGTVLWNNGK